MNKFSKSFYYAFEGFKAVYPQRNFKIHLIIAASVILAGLFFGLSAIEWILIFMMIGVVISAEVFNTAIEEICNLITKKLKLDYYDTWDPRNLAAGGVLFVAITAAIVGLIIFIPKIIGFFN